MERSILGVSLIDITKIGLYSLTFLLCSCSSMKKLFIESIGDSKFKAYKGYFSGCRYISVKKIKNTRTDFTLLYQCDCISEERNHIVYKTIKGNDGTFEDWISVTDTSLTYEKLIRPGVSHPIIFRKIEEDEVKVLEKAINEGLSGRCTKNLKEILGYVKIISSDSH